MTLEALLQNPNALPTAPKVVEELISSFDRTDVSLEEIARTAARQGHVLLRVEPGGSRYRVIVLDDSREDGNVLSVHGPYESRGKHREAARK